MTLIRAARWALTKALESALTARARDRTGLRGPSPARGGLLASVWAVRVECAKGEGCVQPGLANRRRRAIGRARLRRCDALPDRRRGGAARLAWRTGGDAGYTGAEVMRGVSGRVVGLVGGGGMQWIGEEEWEEDKG